MRETAKLRRTNTDFGQVGMDCYVEFREAVRLGDHADLDEGFAQFTHHRTYSRPKPPVKAISTIHKAKAWSAMAYSSCRATRRPFPTTCGATSN
jgi:hypothetical protein